MRFIGYGWSERPADLSKCLAEISNGQGGFSTVQCSRAPLPGKLRCKQHEAKNTLIAADDPIVATVTLGNIVCNKLEKRGWLKGTDTISETLKRALDRIVALESCLSGEQG